MPGDWTFGPADKCAGLASQRLDNAPLEAIMPSCSGAIMATYKLNIAKIRGCPPPAELDKALAAYGLPEDD